VPLDDEVTREPRVDRAFDLRELRGRRLAIVRVVEAQALVRDVRAALDHVRAKDTAQRRLQQVRERVVPHHRRTVIREAAREAASRGRARALSVLVEHACDAVAIDRDPTARSDLERELDRKAVGLEQVECALAVEHGQLLQLAEALHERPLEA
jgi:hypothetical protein